jgi:hypothetical protein
MQQLEDDPPKPMSEEDVAKEVQKLSKLDSKQISLICNGYVQQIKALITTARKSLHPVKDEDEIVELDRLIRLIGMVSTDEVFIRSKDKVWHARKHILEKDADWFLKRDYSKMIKKDQKQSMIETIIRIIQTKFATLSEQEKDQYWMKAIGILGLVAKFKKLTDVPETKQ